MQTTTPIVLIRPIPTVAPAIALPIVNPLLKGPIVPTVPTAIPITHETTLAPIPMVHPITLNVQRPTPIGLNMIQVPKLIEQVRELVLRPWQIEWSHRAHDILLRNHGYIDTSRMGSGKTYVALWLAKQFGFRILIVCPIIVMDIWRLTAAEYGVEVIDIISYQSLRSQKDHQPKHGYLYRHDNTTEGGIHQISFTPTQGYLDLIEQGVLVICDEIQNIKNNSAQYKACNAMIRPILSAGGQSRFGLLSGTPLDKEEHVVNLLRLVGYIRAHRLYNYIRETRQLVLEGMQELIDACRFIDREETEQVLTEIPLVKGKMNHLCYTLYVRVIKASISGAMPAPTNMVGEFVIKNGFYNMTAQRQEDLRNAINQLADAVRFNERTGTATMGPENIGAVTTALVNIENSKVDDFARLATQILTANPQNKVIIAVNYTSSINEIRNLLLPYNPLILNGQVLAKKRGVIVRQFNENPIFRLLIMNTAVGGIGISLHDKIGNAPRFMLMSPSYKAIETAQAADRINRDGRMSDANVRIVYGKGPGMQETGVLNAMARKTQVLKGMLEDVVTRNLILPGDYPREVEQD